MAVELTPILVIANPTFPPLPPVVQPPYIDKPVIYELVNDFGEITQPTRWDPRYVISLVDVFTVAIKALETNHSARVAALPAELDKLVADLAISGDGERSEMQALQRDGKIIRALLEGMRRELAQQEASVRPEFRVSNIYDRRNAVHAYNTMSMHAPYNVMTPNEAYKIWTASYRAQYMANFLNKQIAYLDGKLGTIDARIAQIAADPVHQSEQRVANTFQAPTSLAQGMPFVAASSGLAVIAADAEIVLRDAIRLAVQRIGTAVVGAVSGTVAVFAVLMSYSPKLGDGTRHSLSVPLSDLQAAPGDLQELALQGGELELDVRLDFATVGQQLQLYAAQTGGNIPAGVKVRQASFDPVTGNYTFQTGDVPPRTLVWTPISEPGDSSTTLPPTDADNPGYTGPVLHPIDPLIETYPSAGETGIDDYVFVFPADSGLEPVYVMFRGRRDEPGVAEGFGETISGPWLPVATAGAGAAIPSQIADELRGREFSSFDRMREAVWIEVALDENLAAQFSTQQRKLMSQGVSPFAPVAEQVGGRVKYELHHDDPIAAGGAVYDVDNLRVLTPKRHIEIHSNKGGN